MADVNDKKSIELKRIQKYAELLAESGTRAVFKNKIKDIKGITSLKDSDKIAIFESFGIKVEGTENIKSWLPSLIDDTTLKKISESIAILKEQKDSSGQVPQNIYDVYDFIAYISDDMTNAETYVKKPRDELLALVMSKISRYVNATTDYAHAWSTLCSLAKNNILATEELNKSYKNSLKYVVLSEELSELTKIFTDDDKRLSSIADILINKICGYGYSQKEAIALYNKIVNLIGKDPYIPEQAALVIKCEKCGTLNRFNNIGEAEKSNCNQCSNQLYMICPNCSKRTPSAMDYCINCNFLVVGIKNFDIYYQKALNSLALYDFVEAKKQLSNAKFANPKDSRLSNLEKRISGESAKFEKPIREIERLISERKLKLAHQYLYGVREKYPALNLSTFEKEIKTILTRLDKLFNDSKKLSQQKQIEACEQIIGECTDHYEALTFLKSVPPCPCASISSETNEQGACIIVSWTPSPDKNVSYTLVRKEDSVPASPKDGKIISKDTNQLFHNDSDILSGKEYGYSIFVKRADIYSIGKSLKSILSQEVGNVKHLPDNANGILISWDIPLNCQKIRIYRKENSIPLSTDKTATKVYDGLTGSYNDKDMKTNCTYGYRIQAVYATTKGEIISQGITFTQKIEEKLISFEISASGKGLESTVSWKNLKNNCTIKIVELKSGKIIPKDKKILVSDISNYGTTISTLPSSGNKTTFSVKQNRCFDIVAFAYFSNEAIASNTKLINTYLPITVESCDARKDKLIIKLKEPIPQEAKFVCYGIRSSKPYWLEPSDLLASSKVSIENYRKQKNELIIKNNQDLSGWNYLTLFTEYSMNGKTILSSAAKERVRFPMNIDINFSIKSKKDRKSFEFIMTVKVIKGAVTELPPFNIVYSNGNSEVVIATTEEIKIKGNASKYKKTFNETLPSDKVKIKIKPSDISWLKDLTINPRELIV
jgi:tetratricopeptide (TPR) repeat protein